MRLLYCGDVVGRSGRSVVLDHLPDLRRRLNVDVVVVNGENAAGGFGLTAQIAHDFYDAGADAITLGNHVWDQRELISYIERDERLVRPLNLLPGAPGRGLTALTTPAGHTVVVAQVMGRLFMGQQYDDPFRAIDAALTPWRLGGNAQAIIVDVHAEATSEKCILGHHLDGCASLVVGTHTHIPTADHQVLPNGTAYITDVGMCGDYDSVIGMDKVNAVAKLQNPLPGPRLSPALGPGTLCAVLVETDLVSGLAIRIEPVRVGGRLSQATLERAS